ncbi:EAL domain-containing protein [Ideonella sp. A 288]|uniref:bifunctional diguanylate cyclase/phosphodiesterase n=1 Tax=Ideonella sp. A 288 TaxID=1962181 RepID=UPI000B4C01E4|nr:EAL domain-containing protein [Ideonella sp. A 288]
MSPSPPLAARVQAWAVRLLLIVIALVVAGQLARVFPPLSFQVPMLWPLSGVALAVLLHWGAGCVPALWIGSAIAAFAVGAPPGLAVALGAGSTAGAWMAAHWLGRAVFDRRLPQRRDLLLLLGIGILGGTMLSATNAAAWLAAFGRIAPSDLPATWLARWASESLGLLVLGVPLITTDTQSWRRAFNPERWPGTTSLMLASVAAAAFAFLLNTSAGIGALVPLLLLPVLVCWLALRSGAAVASACVAVLATGLLVATAFGLGPFAAATGGRGTGLLFAFLLSLTALVLMPHVLIGELGRLEARWQLALDGSDIGVADWNMRTGEGYTSPRWRALLSDPDGVTTDSIARLLAHVHPEDRPPLLSALAAIDSPPGAGLRHEARLQVPEGWYWFDLHVIVTERDAAGAPLRIIASIADIGARRSAQERQTLSSNLFLHLHEGLLITDAEMRVLDANPTYSRITGVPREELIGTVPSLLRAGSSNDQGGRMQQAAMWADLRTSGHWVGEVVDRRRNGDPCALQVTVSTVNGPDATLRYHVMVVSDITEQRLQRERLERQALYDELTRLPNRAHLSQLMTEAMRSAEADGHVLAVCCLDIDHFKAVNDRHGSEAGDRLLAELAIRLRSALRSRGAARADVAARLGGDEFVLLLHAGSVDETRHAIDRVLGVVGQPFAVAPNDELVRITASVGATLFPMDGSDADTLLRHADHAMYDVKQAGRNGFEFFDPEHRRRAEERVVAIGRVQEALDEGELVLYYQPKVDLRRGVVLGVEALLRWNHPDHGVVSPVHFLPLIEHTGLSARIGDHVLARALDQLDAWQAQGLDLSVSVNITARHLQEADFVQRLAELLGRHSRHLGPRLELEVLETAALTDIGFTSSLLERCARLGVRWALDDFGTGYSTLTYLKRLPVQVLKIDRSFVKNMLTDAQDRAIVEGVVSLARTFDCTAVAEGVETPAQARMLLDMGCEIGQGEGIAAPMPAAQVAEWVANWRGLFALAPALVFPPPAAAAGGHPGAGD